MSKPLPLLYVEWLDAGAVTVRDWLTLDEITEDAKPENYINKTVGWLLKEDNDCIVVAAQSAKIDGEKPEWDMVMFIPKSLIRKRKVLKL